MALGEKDKDAKWRARKSFTGERLFLGHILVCLSLSAFNPFVVGAYNGSAEWSSSSSGWVGWVGRLLLGWLCYAGLCLAVVCLDFADRLRYRDLYYHCVQFDRL